MPQPNKSQSPPHPRYPPSQGSITVLPSEPRPMRNPSLFISNASVRRIVSRRARPAATSIADIFVRSLVVAGYCHEHAPQRRGLSTTSTKASRGITRNWEDRGGRRSSRRLPAQGPPEPLSQLGRLGVCRSGTQKMLGSSVAQRVEVQDPEDQRVQQASARQNPHRTDIAYPRVKPPDHLGKNSLSSRLETVDHHRLDCDVDTCEKPARFGSDGVQIELVDKPDEPDVLDGYGDHKSQGKRLYKHTREIYEALLGGTLAWKEAADAVAVCTSYPPRFDDTKSAVEISSVRNVEESVLDKTRKNHYMFELYRELPNPGVKYLSKRTRGALLRRFARPPNLRWVDARRYLALVEDMLAARLPLSRSLWTSAIYLAGRSSGKVTKHDLIRSIGIWNQMEHLAGVVSDNVVFTLLFDIAVKARQFKVADRLIEEMDRRDLQFERSGKVALIFYHGVKEDADGVGRAFDDFVQSGEIVDTAVMNCVFASLLRCGERDLAEEIYYRLLETRSTSDLAKLGLTSEFAVYRKSSKKLGRVLQLSASLKDSFPDHHAALQKALELGPDTRTFHVLLTYHVRKTGNLNAIKHILKDMEKYYVVPPRGMIYLLLFEGFAMHGSQKHNRWNANKLRKTWETYLRALYESEARMRHLSSPLSQKYAWENPLESSGDNASPDWMDEESQPMESHSFIPDMRDFFSPVYGHDTPYYATEAGASSINSTEQLLHEENHPSMLENQLENGVFLGRRMIMLVLRAYGGLCDPDEIIDVHLLMMDIWQPSKRRMLDVAAVREELEYQLNRAERRTQDDWQR